MGMVVYNNPDDNWFKEKQEDEYAYSVRACVVSLIGIIAVFLLSWLLSGCRSIKEAVIEEHCVKDSVGVEIIERVVEVPVVVTVEVPAEKHERMTNDTVSVLETGFAKSEASLIWKGDIPFLFHSIENKSQKIEKQDTVPVVEKEVVKWKIRTEYKTNIVEKEKQLTKWQKACMSVGEVFLFVCMIIVLMLVVGLFFNK